ncbi:thioredoxin domain-containing protein 16 isoform X1 [Oncorhynchus keta]|uniref:thioredoxin domain-containing protein 16 isoform X1 n=1 Tax=Oncorhynchus keta TaxID=8018 RepID=UPI00227BB90F|nr:thioredoxin domain-containing protein 16 isoform X1 [Oncorhynchus keta]XP_052366585.1 thioredoxin domain-containing protein 16 isoform X1 [Oncorhynchus keta]
MAWFMCVVILLLCSKSEQCTTGNASKLIEHTAAHFFEKMQSGKMYFIYFGKQVNPTLGLFIEQLEKSADVLEDYGISVAKVNCTNEHIAKYCTGEKLMKKVYLFRGGNVLKSFDTDTVFDVNAIVSHVLFTVLFDEVRYVHTIAELQSVERAAKGKADIVLGHVQVLGLPEHRALMETAFVYGVKYQFVLTTGGPVLTNMGVEDISSLTAGLWFLHCKGASQSQHSDPCPHTALRRALTTLHIYTFLQLMEAPLVSEASVEPSEVNMVHSHLQVPLLFLFSQPHTVALDRVTAQTLAWRLRGQVGLVLIHRESPDVKIPLEYNAAYRLPGEGSEVKYLILNNLEEVIDLFRDESTPEEEEDDDNWATLDVLDDEVAESVYRARGQSLDMDAVTELTADTFHRAVAESDYTVVLFYVKWDAVSMAFMQSYIEVSESLEDADISDVELAVLDCGEWTDVCSAQKIRSFPTVRLYRPQEPSQPYQGMLGTESLNRFIMLSRLVSPVLLSSPDEVTSFLEGDLYQRHAAIAPVTVLGLFSSTADAGVPVFKEAAKALRGETMVGLFADRQAEIWAVEYSVTLPAILVSRGPTGQTEAHSLNLSMPDQLVTHIQRALLDTFPELTVENLPLYLEVKKKLLLLFVGEEESGRKGNKRVLDDMRSLLNTGLLNPYLPCWIHLGRTPAGKAVLEAYLGFLPLLPALVVSQLATGGEVFHYPTGRPFMVQAILQWLQRVEDGEEPPAGVIVDEKWMPSMPFYDFLSVMDQEVPGYASQRSAKTKTNRIERAEGEKEKSSSGGGERQARTGANNPQGSPTTKPPQTSHHHSEL